MTITKILRGAKEAPVYYVEDRDDDSVFVGPFATETDAQIYIELHTK